MAGATCAAEHISHGRYDNPRLLSHAIGVDFFIIGAEQIIATSAFELGAVCHQGTRIFIPIFIQAKLQRVHENTRYHHITIALSNLHQFDMGIMQVTHSRHKSYPFTGFTLCRQRVSKSLDVMKNLHLRNLFKEEQRSTKTGADNTRLPNPSTFLLIKF